MAAQSVNRSSVKILKALSPKTFNGIGVVPPVPKTDNNVIDKPKKI